MEIPGYEIIGELAVDRDARRYLARRTDDGADVLLTVVAVPEGDEGNALNHLASDVKLMTAHPHPGIVRVLDGRWTDDAFVVVTPRPTHPSLEELLIRRNEEFPFVRIAMILRDINAALVWARERGVVHRAIRLENVFVEPGSDRTVVAFNARPIGLTHMPSAEEDDRTIAGLASAMFTRGRRPDQESSLAEVRPGLPTALVAQTDALLRRGQAEDETPLPDITSYIASIAMAEALRDAEIHLEKNRHLMEEQQRAHQAQLEKERHEHAEALAREKAAHQKEREAHRRDLEAYAHDREVLRAEREAYETERELLRRERAQHDREMSTILAQKARQRTREGVEFVARGWRRRPMWARRPNAWKRVAPVALGATLVLVAALALFRRDGRVVPLTIDSAAGTVTTEPGAQPAEAVPSAPVSVDPVPAGLIAGVAARAESLAAVRRQQNEPPLRREEPVAPRPERRLDTIFTSPQLPLPDTTVANRPRRDTVTRRDTLVRSAPVVRTDTIVRPSTNARRDSLVAPIDTLGTRQQPDSLSRP